MSAHQLPPEFIAFWQHIIMFCRHRGARTAHRHLRHLWRTGQKIPGYPTVEGPRAGDYPRGWSYANLLMHRPSKAAMQILRTGGKQS